VTAGSSGLLEPNRDWASNKILALHRDRNGYLWIGSSEPVGLTRFHDGQVKIFTEEDGLIDGRIRSIIEDHEGNLWLATAGGVSRLKDGRFANYPILMTHMATSVPHMYL